MTGKNISTSVNRAFTTMGALFFAGGIYLGILIFLNAPEIYTVTGTIESVRVEKSRPLGFEDIPVDTDDPEYADLPLYVDTYGIISYEFNSREYRSEILSWYSDNDWQEGQTRTFFLIEGEEDIPYEDLPGEVAGEKKEALIIGLAMSLMGLVLFSVSMWQKGKEKKMTAGLIDKVNKMKKQNYSVTLPRGGKVLYETGNRGNFLLGAIITVIGFVFLAVGISEILTRVDLEMKMMLAFPAFIGMALLYMGGSEFVSDRVTVNSKEVRLVHKALWGWFDETRKTSSFAGIDENILEREVPGSLKRHIFREQVLVHEDSRFNDLSIKLIPDDGKANEEAKALAQALNLPRIIRDGDRIRLEYPEGDVLQEQPTGDASEGSTWKQSDPFPGKYLKLVHFDDSSLKISRPYGKSMVWGIFILAGGVITAVLTGYAALLFPFVMMGLIFLGIGLKNEVFEVSGGIVTLNSSFAGKPYRSQEIPLSDLQELKTGSDIRMNNARCLEIIGSRDRILFGQAAREDELDWVRHCLEYIKKQL